MQNKFPYKFIAIEGNIGAGKTTLAQLIAELTGGHLVLERFEENPFLKDFYTDKDQHALDTEYFFLKDRIQQMQTLFTKDHSLLISDFSLYKSMVFSKLNLSDKDQLQFQELFLFSIQPLYKPDLIIHLMNPTHSVLERIQKRGRPYELSIQEEYLSDIEKAYMAYWKSEPNLNVLLIEPSEFTFPYQQEEIIQLLEYLQKSEIKGITQFQRPSSQ